MSEELSPLHSTEGLDAALRESFSHPVLILKHSRTCGISAQAHEELAHWLKQTTLEGPAYVVTMQTDREIAIEITERLGVRHESPQALVIRDGRVTWHGSHFRVTPAAIEQALST